MLSNDSHCGDAPLRLNPPLPPIPLHVLFIKIKWGNNRSRRHGAWLFLSCSPRCLSLPAPLPLLFSPSGGFWEWTLASPHARLCRGWPQCPLSPHFSSFMLILLLLCHSSQHSVVVCSPRDPHAEVRVLSLPSVWPGSACFWSHN